MEPSWIEPGAVFHWSHDDTPLRALVCDDGVVMHDAWWPHLGTWGLANLHDIRRKRISYYVAPVATLRDKATYLRTEPLTDDEVAIHRPDLPFSIARCAGLEWTADMPATTAEMAQRLRSAGCVDSGAGATVNAPEIYLYPFGPDGAQKPGIRVKADDATAFTAAELLRRAATAQAPLTGDALPTRGVGIYRDGLQRGLPAYYLWGHESRLDTQIASARRRQST